MCDDEDLDDACCRQKLNPLLINVNLRGTTDYHQASINTDQSPARAQAGHDDMHTQPIKEHYVQTGCAYAATVEVCTSHMCISQSFTSIMDHCGPIYSTNSLPLQSVFFSSSWLCESLNRVADFTLWASYNCGFFSFRSCRMARFMRSWLVWWPQRTKDASFRISDLWHLLDQNYLVIRYLSKSHQAILFTLVLELLVYERSTL